MTGRRPIGHAAAAKIPAVTLGFWVVKVFATTLGETAGDAVTMTLGLGYLIGTAIFAAAVAVAVAAQIRASRYQPFLYWAAIVATTTAGTTLADFFDRSLGIGYAGGSAVLLASVLGMLAWWRLALGTVAVEAIASPKAEAFYWATIMVSQTLGTALGDWTADSGLGYEGGAVVFAVALAAVAVGYFFTRLPRAPLFWAAFILTRPLGATLGDLMDKPVADGGFALGRFSASAVLLALMAGGILLLSRRPGQHPGGRA